jgi:hypothetical protein
VHFIWFCLGIPFFPDQRQKTLFELQKAETFETVGVDLIYRRNKSSLLNATFD